MRRFFVAMMAAALLLSAGALDAFADTGQTIRIVTYATPAGAVHVNVHSMNIEDGRNVLYAYYNQRIELTAADVDSYSFKGWYEGESLISTETKYSFDAKQDVVIYALYVKNSYDRLVFELQSVTELNPGIYPQEISPATMAGALLISGINSKSWDSKKPMSFTFDNNIAKFRGVTITYTGGGNAPATETLWFNSKSTEAVIYTKTLGPCEVSLTENMLSISPLKPVDERMNKTELLIEPHISIAPGYKGEIKLSTVDGEAFYSSYSCVPAVSKPFIDVSFKPVQMIYGSKIVDAADIIINESFPGALSKEAYDSFISGLSGVKAGGGKYTVNLIYKGNFEHEMTFINSGVMKTRILAGNIKLGGPSLVNGGLSFSVENAGNYNSKFEITGLSIDTKYTEKSGSYGLGIGGALAANYCGDGGHPYGTFNVPAAVFEDYCKLEASANWGRLRNIAIQPGSTRIKIDGTGSTLDSAPYIDPVMGIIMVPMRFICYALGIKDTEILWDAELSAATILDANRTIVFKENSSVMKINGIDINMTETVNGKTVEVKPIIDKSTGRFCIPFRILGGALGIPVGWNPKTGVAYYNPNREQLAGIEAASR